MNRNDMFQHLVLNALWVLIVRAYGGNATDAALNFRSSAISFGDMYGNQSEEAKKYRREVTYGGSLT
jgi:hypothetical protein